MADAWEKVAPEQRASELIDLIEEQKEKDIEHSAREDAQEERSGKKIIELSDLIETLARHVMDLEFRVSKLEKEERA
jgi:hypothetical protein